MVQTTEARAEGSRREPAVLACRWLAISRTKYGT